MLRKVQKPSASAVVEELRHERGWEQNWIGRLGRWLNNIAGLWMKHWVQLICLLLAAAAPQASGYAPGSALLLPESSFDPVWNLADASGYSFCGGDPVNRFDTDGRVGKAALNWATGIDLDSNVPLAEQIQAHRQGGAEYLWSAIPAFVDVVAGSVIASLFTPQDLWVMEQRTMGANTPGVQAYDQLAQIVYEHVGSPLAGLGVYDPGSVNAQWGRDLGKTALFVAALEGTRSQINWQPGRVGRAGLRLIDDVAANGLTPSRTGMAVQPITDPSRLLPAPREPALLPAPHGPNPWAGEIVSWVTPNSIPVERFAGNPRSPWVQPEGAGGTPLTLSIHPSNPANRISRSVIPPGTRIQTGIAAPVPEWGGVGGAKQILILDNNVWQNQMIWEVKPR